MSDLKFILVGLILIILFCLVVAWDWIVSLFKKKRIPDIDIWTASVSQLEAHAPIITVTYANDSVKHFNPDFWVLLRDGIKQNLYDKDLIKVDY